MKKADAACTMYSKRKEKVEEICRCKGESLLDMLRNRLGLTSVKKAVK